MKTKEELAQLQREMKERNQYHRKEELLSRMRTEENLLPLPRRTVCIACNRRVARIGSPYCSRCTGKEVSQGLRDTLPGVKKNVNNVNDSPISQDHNISSNTFVTSAKDEMETSEEVICTKGEDYASNTSDNDNRSDSTVHLSNSRVDQGTTYARAQVAEMLGVSPTTLMRWERKGAIDQPIRIAHSNQCVYTQEMIDKAKEYMNLTYQAPASLPNTPEARLPSAAKKQVKINRRMERAVASRLGSLGRMLR